MRRGVSEGVAIAALLLGLIGYYGAYALMVFASLLVLWSKGLIRPLSLAMGVTLLAIALGIPVFVLRLRRLDARSLPGWFAAVPGARSLLAAVVAAPADLLRSPWLIARAIAFEGLVFLADATTLWTMLRAVGHPTGLGTALVGFASASVVATLSPIPLGLGTFEATAVAMLGVQGVPIEPALAATLLLRGATVWLPMLPGLWLVRG